MSGSLFIDLFSLLYHNINRQKPVTPLKKGIQMKAERAYTPAKKRPTFTPSSNGPVILQIGDKLYLQPVQAADVDADITLELLDDGNPAGPRLVYGSVAINTNLGYNKNPGIDLLAIAEAVNTAKDPVTFTAPMTAMEECHSIFGLLEVNLEDKTVTLALDAAFEICEYRVEPAVAR